MKAIIRTKAGKDFSTMKVMEINPKRLESNEVRVKMHSSRINPVDMDLMKGFPTIRYEKEQIGGVDGAGEIVEIGSGVMNYEIGDRVFFYRNFTDIGTWAEEISISTDHVAKIPEGIDTITAGSIALPLMTAYESIMALNPMRGDKILIHGAGGGVGFMAVLVSKALGLNVIANASLKDKEILEKVGVDEFIDYKTTDFYEHLKNYPPKLVFDVLGKKTLMKSIELDPIRIISMAIIEPQDIYKTGMKVPSIILYLMKLATSKYRRAAYRRKVKLLGQVTGSEGRTLEKAIELISDHFIPNLVNSISLDEISRSGLSKSDIGKVIIFNEAIK